MSLRVQKKHSLATRWFHWVNFPVLAMMVWSGLLIYWANDVYQIGPFRFFPTPWYRALHIEGRLAEGLAWHFAVMWLFSLNGLAYVAYTVASGSWRELVPTKGTIREALHVVLYDLKLTKQHPSARKFNGAQRIAYTSIVVMGLGSLLTGLAIYKPAQLRWLTALLGGYETARLVHFALTVGYGLFFTVHIAQVVRAGWNNFRAMVTGHELVNVEPQEGAA